MDFWRFSAPDPALGSPVHGSYDLSLVFLSILVACYAGLTALLMVDRMVASRSNPARTWWLCSGAIAMGCGIWAMHFTGMLAFSLPMKTGYDLVLTLVSLVPAVLGSGAALYFMTHTSLTGWRLQLGALLMALGIGTMHYTGMEAMDVAGFLRYDFLYFCLSIAVAHILSMLALWIRFGLQQLPSLPLATTKIIAGTIMGVAVAGMHYTAMAASRFYQVAGAQLEGWMFSHTAMASTISGFGGIILTLSVLATWIHRQKGIQRLLEHLAHTDVLTGLPNRALFKKRLEYALTRNRDRETCVAVLFLDLDDFKTINDSLGHAAGDRVLQELGSRLQLLFRGEDMVARFGGDEFIVLVQNLAGADDAAPIAERVMKCLKTPVELSNWNLHHEASIGISIYPDDGTTADELIQQADAAMYRAKKEGLGYRFFDKAITDQAIERVHLASDLRDALAQDQLVVFYQPWVDLESVRWIGLEALARWPHPKLGWVGPDRFIPVAERSGLMVPLGKWAITEACRQGRLWLDAEFELERISVNIAAPQLVRNDLVAQVSAILDETGFPGNRLELEITESTLMGNDPATIRQLQKIRDLGVTLAIDDFGTGYSSLSYLKDLPVDKLKIDQAFINSIVDDHRNHAITTTVVEMGARLGFSVVAEGVETVEQQRILLDLGCKQAQGFLFARPAGTEEIEANRFFCEKTGSEPVPRNGL